MAYLSVISWKAPDRDPKDIFYATKNDFLSQIGNGKYPDYRVISYSIIV